MGDRGWVGAEAGPQLVEVRQQAGLEDFGQAARQFGLAATLVRQGQQGHRGAAGFALRPGRQEGVKGLPIGLAREQLVAIDEAEQGHRLAPQGMDHVVVADDAVVAAARPEAPARQRGDVRAADEHVQAIVVEAHSQPVADQARGHGVEHLAQPEASRRADADRYVLVVGRAAVGQAPEVRTLGLDALGVPSVAEPDDAVHEGTVGRKVGEVGRGAQQQGVGERALEVAVRTLHRAVLVCHAGVVARGLHAVMGAQRVVARREVRLGVGIEVAEGRR